MASGHNRLCTPGLIQQKLSSSPQTCTHKSQFGPHADIAHRQSLNILRLSVPCQVWHATAQATADSQKPQHKHTAKHGAPDSDRHTGTRTGSLGTDVQRRMTCATVRFRRWSGPKTQGRLRLQDPALPFGGRLPDGAELPSAGQRQPALRAGPQAPALLDGRAGAWLIDGKCKKVHGGLEDWPKSRCFATAPPGAQVGGWRMERKPEYSLK